MVLLTPSWLINASEIGPGKSAIIRNNRAAFFGIHTPAIFLISGSLIASIIVILHIYLQWRNAPSKLDFFTRFPLYLAVADLLWGLGRYLDHMYLVTVQSYPRCPVVTNMLSMNLYFFFGYQHLMHASVAGYTYLRVVHRKPLNLGKWEWKLQLLWGSYLLVTMTIFYFLDSFGNSGYWMAVNLTTVKGLACAVVSALGCTTNAIVSTTCYYRIRSTVEKTKSSLQTHQHPQMLPSTMVGPTGVSPRQQSLESQCLTTYVWVAVCLYCPMSVILWVVLFISNFLRVVEPVSSLFLVLVCNSSGWANAYGYFYNQQLKKGRQQEKYC